MSASRSKRNCLDPHLAVIFALGALWATTPGTPAVAASRPPTTEQHIQHIQDALVPPVLVKGVHRLTQQFIIAPPLVHDFVCVRRDYTLLAS
jgi:hypothetical protein